MNPSSEVWFIHLSVITAVQLQQMGWQGASWHHPAQTHTHTHANACTHVPHIPHTCTCTHTHLHKHTHTPRVKPVLHIHAHARIHKSVSAYEVFSERQREKGGGKSLQSRKPKCLSVCLFHMGLLHMLHSLSSKWRDLGAKIPALSL